MSLSGYSSDSTLHALKLSDSYLNVAWALAYAQIRYENCARLNILSNLNVFILTTLTMF